MPRGLTVLFDIAMATVAGVYVGDYCSDLLLQKSTVAKELNKGVHVNFWPHKQESK
jgi:hypothetical protein